MRVQDKSTGQNRGKSYDEFFASHSPVNRLQFWGFVLLGGGFIATGLALLAIVLSRFSFKSLDALAMIVLLVPCGISGAIICFGVLHIKRALVGRHSR